MKQKTTGHSTAFYAEALVLIAVFFAVIVLLVQCFAAADGAQKKARALNDAVVLARNAAEAAAESGTPDGLLALLAPGRSGGTGESELLLRYNDALQTDPDGRYRLRMTWQDDGSGLFDYHIVVEQAEGGRTIYSLDTSVYAERGPAS